LQETPIAISAFTADALERQLIGGTDDLDQVSPNLQFASYGPLTGNNAAAQVYIRGIGQSDGSSGVDPGVGLYIDRSEERRVGKESRSRGSTNHEEATQ